MFLNKVFQSQGLTIRNSFLLPLQKKSFNQKNVKDNKTSKAPEEAKKPAGKQPLEADKAKAAAGNPAEKSQKKPQAEEELVIDQSLQEKYKGLLVGLSKDWEKISRSSSVSLEKNVSNELTNGQKEYIDLLARKYSDFNVLQSKYFAALFKERVDGLSSIPLLAVNKDWQEITDKYKFPIQNEEKPEFPQEKHVLDHLKKWMGNINVAQQSTGSSASAGGANSQAKGAAAEEKKEEKKEKEAYDIELSSFDAGKKIVLIKEIKGLLNLGLKEAKELVEKAPTIIMKSVKKDKTQEIIKKLQENGGNLKLV